MDRVYLDHNATTPVEPAVVDAMAAALRDQYGNASSVHFFGQQAKAALDDARADVARLICASPTDVIFTSGGTESDNLALRGLPAGAGSKRHVVLSAIEHEAVGNTAKSLATAGWKVSIVPVAASGTVDPADVERAIQADTALVSIMHANNEIGTIQPIAEIARIAHDRGALVHTDAVQSAGKIPVDVARLDVDLLSISAHKFGGPKGVGALWMRRGLGFRASMTGGRQERGRRAGTENVPSIIGMGVAARLASERVAAGSASIAALRDRLERHLLDRVPGTAVNGEGGTRVPNTSNVSFEGVEGESLVIAFDLKGIAVSTGSACSSGTLEPSHVLRALGLSTSRVQSAIRFSLGPHTSGAEIDYALEIIPGVIAHQRQVGGARL